MRCSGTVIFTGQEEFESERVEASLARLLGTIGVKITMGSTYVGPLSGYVTLDTLIATLRQLSPQTHPNVKHITARVRTNEGEDIGAVFYQDGRLMTLLAPDVRGPHFRVGLGVYAPLLGREHKTANPN